GAICLARRAARRSRRQPCTCPSGTPLLKCAHSSQGESMNTKVWGIVAAVASAGAAGFAAGALAANGKQIVLVPPEEVKFAPADPNDKEGNGPQIAVVFGDMKTKAPMGFLLKVPAGGKPGPHMHTSDDYAVIIKG